MYGLLKLLFLCSVLSIQIFAQFVSVSSGGEWNDPVTWVGGEVPPADSDVIIHGHVNAQFATARIVLIESENGQPASLTVEGGFSCLNLTVGTGGRIEVDNNLYVYGNINGTGFIKASILHFASSSDQSFVNEGTLELDQINISGTDKKLIIANPLSLSGTRFYLNWNTLVIPESSTFYMDGGYLIDGYIDNSFTLNGAGSFYISGAVFNEDVVFEGIVEIAGGTATAPIIKKNLINTGIVQFNDYPGTNTFGDDYFYIEGNLTNQGEIRGHRNQNDPFTGRTLTLRVDGDFNNNGIYTAEALWANGNIINSSEIDSVKEIILKGNLSNSGNISVYELILPEERTYEFSAGASAKFYGNIKKSLNTGNNPGIALTTDFMLINGAIVTGPISLGINKLFTKDYTIYSNIIGSTGSAVVSKSNTTFLGQMINTDLVLNKINRIGGQSQLFSQFPEITGNVVNYDSLFFTGIYESKVTIHGDLYNYGYAGLEPGNSLNYVSVFGNYINKGINNIKYLNVDSTFVNAGIMNSPLTGRGSIIYTGKSTLPPEQGVYFDSRLYIRPESIQKFMIGENTVIDQNFYVESGISGNNYSWIKDSEPMNMYSQSLPFSVTYYPIIPERYGEYRCVVNNSDTTGTLVIGEIYSPELIYPDGEKKITSLVDFSWEKLNYVDRYRIDVAEDKLFQNIVFSDTALADPTARIQLEEDKMYYWRVNSRIESAYAGDWMGFSYTASFTTDGIVSAEENQTEIPATYSLSQNYPNPFNPATTIRYALPKDGAVRLTIYNLLGQEVTTLVNEYKLKGRYEVKFDASGLGSGMYIYRIDAGSFSDTKRMMLVK